MQLDVDCGGTLDIDELKILMILMGERLDAEEMELLLDEYDSDKSGTLDFKVYSCVYSRVMHVIVCRGRRVGRVCFIGRRVGGVGRVCL